MEKHSELPQEIRQHRQRWLHDRWVQLNTLEKAWGERVFKFLLLTNSGGAIAVLSFLGSYQKAMSLLAAKIALACFLFGIVVVGIATAHAYHRISNGLRGVTADTRRLYRDEMSYADLIARDDKRHQSRLAGWILGYAAFGAFIAGCGCGAYALFSSL